jgi:hypothetical protein
MLTKEFNKLPLAIRSKMVFDKGSLIAVFNDNATQKGFYYTLDDLKIDMIYDKVRSRLLDVFAWESINERGALRKVQTAGIIQP